MPKPAEMSCGSVPENSAPEPIELGVSRALPRLARSRSSPQFSGAPTSFTSSGSTWQFFQKALKATARPSLTPGCTMARGSSGNTVSSGLH